MGLFKNFTIYQMSNESLFQFARIMGDHKLHLIDEFRVQRSGRTIVIFNGHPIYRSSEGRVLVESKSFTAPMDVPEYYLLQMISKPDIKYYRHKHYTRKFKVHLRDETIVLRRDEALMMFPSLLTEENFDTDEDRMTETSALKTIASAKSFNIVRQYVERYYDSTCEKQLTDMSDTGLRTSLAISFFSQVLGDKAVEVQEILNIGNFAGLFNMCNDIRFYWSRIERRVLQQDLCFILKATDLPMLDHCYDFSKMFDRDEQGLLKYFRPTSDEMEIKAFMADLPIVYDFGRVDCLVKPSARQATITLLKQHYDAMMASSVIPTEYHSDHSFKTYLTHAKGQRDDPNYSWTIFLRKLPLEPQSILIHPVPTFPTAGLPALFPEEFLRRASLFYKYDYILGTSEHEHEYDLIGRKRAHIEILDKQIDVLKQYRRDVANYNCEMLLKTRLREFGHKLQKVSEKRPLTEIQKKRVKTLIDHASE